MKKIVILGAGMAGLGAARRFAAAGLDAVIYEKNPYPGGHAASFEDRGFVFDDGPHISFTRDQELQGLLADAVDGRYEVLQTRVNNHWRGHWIKHPAQCNLHGLPTDLVVDIIRDFVAVQGAGGERTRGAGSGEDGGDPPPDEADERFAHYADWLRATYGKTFAETFPMQYGRKYHTARAEDMTTDWLGPRLYRPALEEVLRGALSPETVDVHYVDHFRYPSHGGFAAFLKTFVDSSCIQLEREVARIDPRSSTLRFVDGTVGFYDRLVSSLPLLELIRRIEHVPEDVAAAARRLACTTCVLVNLGIDRRDISEAHWTYFYDDDFVFTRVSFPHMLSPNNTPPGAGSIQAEIYYSDKYRPCAASPGAHIEPTIRDLQRCGLMREDDRILYQGASLVPYANVIFDLDRPQALATVLGYLDELGIATAGRYGRWGYHWTDEAFRSGEEAAQEILDASG